MYSFPCKHHPNQQIQFVCIDINCSQKEFICPQCAQEFHKGHKHIPINQYIQGLQNEYHRIHELLPKYNKTITQCTNLHQNTHHLIDKFQEDFTKITQSIKNLYQFNQDLSHKILKKDIDVLSSLDELNLNQNTQNTQFLENLSNKQQKFINLVAMCYQDNPSLPPNDLIQTFLNNMEYKRQEIENFNNDMENLIRKEIDQLYLKLKNLQKSEVDIIEHLETKISYKRKPNIQTLPISRISDQPGSFARYYLNKDGLLQQEINQLKVNIADFYRIQHENDQEILKNIAFKTIDDHQSIENQENFTQNLQKMNIFCQINQNIKQFNNDVIVIGVSGPTRAGKGTLSNHLRVALDANVISQDLFFNKTKIYEKLNGNWETPEAVKWDEILETIRKEKQISKQNNKQYLIVEGFLLFSQKDIQDALDIKIFLDLSEADIYTRRMRTKPIPEDYFHNCLLKGYKEYKEILQQIKDIHIFDGSQDSIKIFNDSMNIIDNHKKTIQNQQQQQ